MQTTLIAGIFLRHEPHEVTDGARQRKTIIYRKRPNAEADRAIPVALWSAQSRKPRRNGEFQSPQRSERKFVSQEQLGRKKSVRGPFEHNAGQSARCESCSVYIHAIGQNLRLINRGMAVNHDLAKIQLAFQEFVSDPKQVRLVLKLEGDAGRMPAWQRKCRSNSSDGRSDARNLNCPGETAARNASAAAMNSLRDDKELTGTP